MSTNTTEPTKFQKLVSFLSKYGWKGFIALLLACAAALVMSTVSSCSAVRAGYNRTRHIQQYDSTYIHYKPSYASSQPLPLSTVRVRKVSRVRTNASALE